MSRPTRESPGGRAYLDLQNRARREGRGTEELLVLYVLERWLARLADSPHAAKFVLKGGMLLAALGARRPTSDADLLARHLANDETSVMRFVTEVACGTADPDDGVEFLVDTVASQSIRDDALYAGVRVTMNCRVGRAQVKLRP
ncbi:nucleotidyl transferase AbiEii/AbiGii toxin family protein [Actinosynnema sp. NPDC050801]|uniref:nucleotidyl transferase AbiEii/AbiGii toxin family protein n=1 Tax=unclassified Actinosynnema TaxID=2637065 RepID=UPI0034110779